MVRVDDPNQILRSQCLQPTTLLHEFYMGNSSTRERASNSHTDPEIWLPQPIYPRSELSQNLMQPAPSIKLDNNAKKKNVQKWLQKITPIKSTTIQKNNGVSNNESDFISTQQVSANYYGGDFGGDVRL